MSDTNSFRSQELTADPPRSTGDATAKILDVSGNSLLERIGVGGMGEVYRCGDDALQRDLAIKILKAELRGNADAEERFLREARLTGSLQHPGVVPIHNLSHLADGRPCYTMKLVRGRTFADMIRDEPQGPERLPRLLAIIEKVCQAVAYAHSKHVIHRDLKPSNVMVGEFGEVQVMDWGLAKELHLSEPSPPPEATEDVETAAWTKEADGLSRAGSALGTPAYMPPEQAAGDWDIVDERADVFALGAILCEMLTGHPPYHGGGRDDLLRRARRGDLAEALGRLAKCGADAVLVDLCRECLAAERLQRPRHAGVVTERLASYQAEVRERLRQAELQRARAEVKALEERKRRRLLAALALSALVLMASGVAAWWQWQQRRAKADGAVVWALGEARSLLKQAQKDVLTAAGYDKAVAAAHNAVEIAGAGGASEDMRQQAEIFFDEIDRESKAAAKDRRLLAALLEAREPREGPKYSRDENGMIRALAQPTVEEQFASAFRDWGLDVDAAPITEAAARLKARPAAVVTEAIAALDHWASHRRLDRKPEAAARLLELTAALDDHPGSLRRELRDILARDRLPMEQALGVLSAALRPVPLTMLVPAGQDHVRLRRLAEKIDPTQEPVLGLMTLTRALRVAGDDRLAERLLRAAIVARPREVVLYHTLGRLLQTQQPPRWAEAVECYAAARALRPDLGETLAMALLRSNREREGLDLLAAMARENSDNPYLYWQQGNALRDSGELDDAISCYKNAIALDPNYVHALNNLGTALHDKHDLDGAIACYKKVLELDSKYVRAYNNLGNALKQKDDLEGALACYKKALELNPKYAKALQNLGNTLRLKSDRDGAVAYCRQAVAADPKSAAALGDLGLALYEKGDRDEAIACYHKALALDPKDAYTYNNLGNARSAEGDRDGAIVLYRKALALDPKNALIHNNLGLALAGKHDLEGAIACYRKALAFDPRYAEAYNNLGSALNAKGDLKGAIACYRQAIALKPRDRRDPAVAYTNLGAALEKQGDRDGACYRKAIELNPSFASAYNNLGAIWEKQGDLEGAINYYKLALKFSPQFAGTYANLGNALKRKGDRQGAIASYRQALRLDPQFVVAHYNLGNTLSDMHDVEGAIACYRQALKYDPQFAAAYTNLGNALLSKGEIDSAIECYRQSLAIDAKLVYSHTGLGDVLKEKRDLYGAIASYRKAIALDPNYVRAHIGLGDSFFALHNLDDAIVCYKKAIDLAPTMAQVHFSLSVALSGKGDKDGAIACYKKAIDLNPNYVAAYCNLGAILCDDKHDLDGAIANFKRALALDKKFVSAHHNLGIALQKKGDPDGAIACFKQAVALDPKDARLHYKLGAALYDKPDLDAAIACFKQALDLDPHLSVASNGLGGALRDKGDLNGAIACFKQAIAADPKGVVGYGNLGSALQRQGRFNEALIYYKQGHDRALNQPGWRKATAKWVREAERFASLEGKLSALLKGEATPANPREAVVLAMMCQHTKRYAASARLYADAFAAEPMLANEHRYDAACSAVQAAAGRGEDAHLLPDKVASMFRSWALGWLRDQLNSYAQAASRNDVTVKQTIRQRMAQWRRDADLPPVRDRVALERLAENERAAWQALWSDVDELAARMVKKTD